MPTDPQQVGSVLLLSVLFLSSFILLQGYNWESSAKVFPITLVMDLQLDTVSYGINTVALISLVLKYSFLPVNIKESFVVFQWKCFYIFPLEWSLGIHFGFYSEKATTFLHHLSLSQP